MRKNKIRNMSENRKKIKLRERGRKRVGNKREKKKGGEFYERMEIERRER